MPRKTKPLVSPDEVWVAPRPADQSKPRTFEPVNDVPTNRYLEFADIALGAKKPSPHRNKPRSVPVHAPQKHEQHHQVAQNKVTPINSRTSRTRGPNQGFGAFRNHR